MQERETSYVSLSQDLTLQQQRRDERREKRSKSKAQERQGVHCRSRGKGKKKGGRRRGRKEGRREEGSKRQEQAMLVCNRTHTSKGETVLGGGV